MLTRGCFSCPCVVNKYVLKVLERERIKELMVRSRIDDPLGDPQGEDLAMLGPVAKARGRARGILSLLFPVHVSFLLYMYHAL